MVIAHHIDERLDEVCDDHTQSNSLKPILELYDFSVISPGCYKVSL